VGFGGVSEDFLRIGIAAGLLAVAPAAYGADASGTWKGAFDFEAAMWRSHFT